MPPLHLDLFNFIKNQMLRNAFENGLLLVFLHVNIINILAVSNGAKGISRRTVPMPTNDKKPVCVIPKETIPEFALFEKKTGKKQFNGKMPNFYGHFQKHY
jgi:hypothetical protein